MTRVILPGIFVAALLTVAAPAMAQSLIDTGDDVFMDSDLVDHLDGARDVDHTFDRILRNDIFDDDLFGSRLRAADLGSTQSHVDRERNVDQKVHFDEDTVLLGIALHNNGFSDVTLENLRDRVVTREDTLSAFRDRDLDRDTAFSAVALGFTDHGSDFDRVNDIADVDVDVRIRTTVDQGIDLDEDNVLLAIALSNNVGGSRSLFDVADVNDNVRHEIVSDQDIDIDREDALLRLLFG